MTTPAAKKSLTDRLRRPMRQVHWISAAVCVFSLCFYAITGFLLNNDDLIKIKPKATHIEKPLSPALAQSLGALQTDQRLEPQAASELAGLFGQDMRYAKARVTKSKLTLTVPEPGVKASIEVDTEGQKLIYDRTERGPIAFMTDLHKGKNVRPLWHWFINIFAISVLVFGLSGLMLLVFQAKMRKITWPLVIAGVGLPALFLVLLMHL